MKKRILTFILCLAMLVPILAVTAGAAQTGWVKSNDTWYYYGSDGILSNSWVKSGGYWYYLGETGAMQASCWLNDGGNWYFLCSSGRMATGWLKISFSAEGEQYPSERPETGRGEWYYFASSGKMQTGWLKYNGSWYYLWPDGHMMRNATMVDGAFTYRANASGRVTRLSGWDNTGGVWEYFKNGIRHTGWLKSGGRWYYLRPNDGVMVYDCRLEIGGKTYIFTDSGALSTGGWEYCTRTDPEPGWPEDNHWYYANSDGTVKAGWLKYNGSWYYLDPETFAMVTGDAVIDGVSYSFSNSGALLA